MPRSGRGRASQWTLGGFSARRTLLFNADRLLPSPSSIASTNENRVNEIGDVFGHRGEVTMYQVMHVKRDLPVDILRAILEHHKQADLAET
jgi:hypothetical protein